MDTIVLLVSSGWGVRTFLQTEVLPELQRHARVVLFCASDLSLQHQDVLQVTLEALPPQHLSRSALNQLGRDSHLSACANDGAFDEQ